MAVGDLYKLTPTFNMGVSGLAQNVHFYETTAEVPFGATREEIGAAFNARMNPEYRILLPVAAEYQGVHVQLWNKATDTPLSSDTFVPETGVNNGLEASDALPSQVAGIISWKTALPGRRNRGRSYFPATGESGSDSIGVPTAAYLIQLGEIAEELSSLFTVIGADGETQIDLVIYSRVAHQVQGVVDWVIRPIWGTQRRRRIGTGI